MREATIQGIIRFKTDSKCRDVFITGGTEVGHSTSTKSHWNGWKVDYRLREGDCVTNYIRKNFAPIGTTSQRWQKYRDSRGNVYVDEIPVRNPSHRHWDVLYEN